MKKGVIDKDAKASLYSAEAGFALGIGDTLVARQKHDDAGALLEQDAAAAKGQDRQLALFLSATQYYLGGNYPKAKQLAVLLNATTMAPRWAGLLPRFLGDVEERSAPGYGAGIRERILAAWKAKNHEAALLLLQEHPFVLPREAMALIRAVFAEVMGKHRAAASLYKSAATWGADPAPVLADMSALPLELIGKGLITEAGEFIDAQLEVFPNPVSHALASLLRYFLAQDADDEAKRRLLTEQKAHLRQAADGLTKWDLEQPAHPGLAQVFDLATQAASLAAPAKLSLPTPLDTRARSVEAALALHP
jgi:hypothetical protein